jgi:hypothetical protein
MMYFEHGEVFPQLYNYVIMYNYARVESAQILQSQILQCNAY